MCVFFNDIINQTILQSTVKNALMGDSIACILQIAKICMLTFLLSFSQAANSAKVTKIRRFQNVNQVVLLYFVSNKKLMRG